MNENHSTPAAGNAESCRDLLNREASPDYVSEWTAHIAAPTVLTQSGDLSVTVFRVATEWLALPTKLFQEVVERCTIRTLTHHGAVVKGLVNVRGELLICVSLNALLGIGAEESSKSAVGRVLILNREGGRFAIQVDEVAGIHRYHETELRSVPSTLAKAGSASYTKGILRWQGRAVSCLDESSLVSVLSQRLG